MAAQMIPVPTESVEQQCLFRWAEYQRRIHPELIRLYHIANGGYRNKATAGRLRAEGVKSGVPDICLPVPRGGYHGLYIELKRIRGGSLSEEQADWLEALAEEGYGVYVCKGWVEASKVIIEYLQRT